MNSTGWAGWQAAGSALWLALITLMTVWQARRRPFLIVGWLWFLGTLVPVIGLVQHGRIPEAIEQYRIILQRNPDQLLALNNLAWLLATDDDSQWRNGTEAVRLAERACDLTHYQTPAFLGTLAAAYAEAGRFDDAVKTEEMVIALVNATGEKRYWKKTAGCWNSIAPGTRTTKRSNDIDSLRHRAGACCQ